MWWFAFSIYLKILFGQVKTAQGNTTLTIRAAEQPGDSNEAQIKNCWILACRMKTANLQGYLYDREFLFFFFNKSSKRFVFGSRYNFSFLFCQGSSRGLAPKPCRWHLRVLVSLLCKNVKKVLIKFLKDQSFCFVDKVEQNWPSKGGSRPELRRAHGGFNLVQEDSRGIVVLRQERSGL